MATPQRSFNNPSALVIPQTAFQTTAWQQIAEHLRTEIERLREENDGDLATEQTAHIRGQLSFAKSLLALATVRVPANRPAPDFYTE